MSVCVIEGLALQKMRVWGVDVVITALSKRSTGRSRARRRGVRRLGAQRCTQCICRESNLSLKCRVKGFGTYRLKLARAAKTYDRNAEVLLRTSKDVVHNECNLSS